MALESFPPLMLVSVRYLASGAIMLIGAKITGAHLPRGKELRETALYGVIALGIGNGCLAFAEQWIPSGLAALFVTTSPFWLVGVEALSPGGERLHLPTIAGMLVGLGGVATLVAPAAMNLSLHSGTLGAFLLLQIGCAGWSIGSILQRRQPSRAHPFVSGAVQQLATGLLYAVPALIRHEPVHWNGRGVLAIIYLMTFGSVVGYSAYLYALDRLPVAVISIYNYINPLVAVFLGWLFYREAFGVREGIAMLIIFAGVWIVKHNSARAAQPAQVAAEPLD
jgi:drug/metabolite transporter (DMT)-like permease